MLGKKCPRQEVLELALFLTLLYGTSNFFQEDGTWPTTLGHQGHNDTGGPAGQLGPTFLLPAPHYHIPSDLSPYLGSKGFEEQELRQWESLDENDYYRERILDELRRLNLFRYSQLPSQLPLDTTHFHNVTAYMLNGTEAGPVGTQMATSDWSRPTFQPEPSFPEGPLLDFEGTFEGPNEDLDSFLLEEMEEISKRYKDEFSLPSNDFVERMGQGDASFLEHLDFELTAEDAGTEEASGSLHLDPPRTGASEHGEMAEEEMLEELGLSLLQVPSPPLYDTQDESTAEDMMSGISPFALHGFDGESGGDEEGLSTFPIPDELWESDSGIFEAQEWTDEESEVRRGRLGRSESADDSLDPFSQDSAGTVDGKWVSEGGEVERFLERSLSPMLQAAPPHPTRPTPHASIHFPQPRPFQVHGLMGGVRGLGGGVDGRYQELSSLNFFNAGEGGVMGHPFSPAYLPHHFHQGQTHYAPPTGPTIHYPDSRGPLLHNASLPQLTPYNGMELSGSALTSAMHLTNQSEPHGDQGQNYSKFMETHQDSLYFQGSSGDLSTQAEGILSSFMNEDNMNLMEMAMSEGMNAMRMMDGPVPHHAPHHAVGGYAEGGEDRLEASSDSAVSSMGTERVRPAIDPSLTDNDWTEAEHPTFSHYTSDKLRGYDYFGKGEGRHRVLAPVAQKKHQMFGKRVLQEGHPMALAPPYAGGGSGLHHGNPSPLDPLDSKYSCGLDFPRHGAECGGLGGSLEMGSGNHSYALPPTHPDHPNMTSRTQRAPPKDKGHKKEHLSRDEKRALQLALPLTTDEIVNLPMDEFNERLSKHDLNEAQLSLIRDIRRRGKNKVAAQNCRKRKIDQITQLENEVTVIRQKKESLLRENEGLVGRRKALSEKYTFLYHHVFQNLRNTDGEAYSSEEWSLVEGGDGNLRLMRRHSPNRSYGGSEDLDESLLRRPRPPPKGREEGRRGSRQP